MGLLSIQNPLRSRDSRRPPLPLYQQTALRSPTKERYSDDDFSSDDDLSDASSSAPSSRSSRQTSSSMSASAAMLPKRTFAAARRPVRPHLYRLPNKVIRFLCIGMISTLVLFILSLVRASQLENKRVAEGKIEKKPVAPIPPAWEAFPFLTRYYGGVRTLVSASKHEPQYPVAKDEQPYVAATPAGTKATRAEDDQPRVPSSKAFADYKGFALADAESGMTECFLNKAKTMRVPSLRYMDGRPQGFPDNVLGSYDLLSLPNDICFERYGRYGPYGYGYSEKTGGLGIGEDGEREGAEAVWESGRVDWRDMNWAEVQQSCYQANAGRFNTSKPQSIPPLGFYIDRPQVTPKLDARAEDQTLSTETIATTTHSAQSNATTISASAPRTAVVVRCWDEFVWREEDIVNLRGLISELSLASGGRYDVHLLVQVRDDAKNPVWADDDTYQNLIKDKIPREFRGMVTLWSTTQMLAIYQGIHDLWTKGPDLPVHGSYRGLQMAMQYFGHHHPEYDYFWQWEMDIRYTGHYYDLLTKLESWAKKQPRKGLWERNARFYLPSVHESWEDFRQMARVQSETGTVGADNIWQDVAGLKSDPHKVVQGEDIIWGPKRPADEKDWFEADQDPVPPTSHAKDKYQWGVGEEADLITLNPIFDPEGTTWGLADDITGYGEPGGQGKRPPRRAHIITASRMSRRLLTTMHRETAFKKHHAFPEMWPATAALHHGYKAVFAPHPQFVDRAWPVEYLASVLNGGRNQASGGSRTAVYGAREHNMRGLTWFYDSGFAPNLYRRWLGREVNNDGGEGFEKHATTSNDDSSVGKMRGGEGRMCLPPMLLHPIKQVDLPVEHWNTDDEVPESDPAA